MMWFMFEKMKKIITKISSSNEFIENAQTKQEFLIYDYVANWIKIRSKCKWCDHGAQNMALKIESQTHSY